MEKFFAILLKNPLFDGISREDLRSLMGCLAARVSAYPKDAPVFLEGDPAGFIGFVLEGKVQIVRDDFYGNRSLLMVAQQGEIFAEAFACANVKTMPLSAFAMQESKVMWLECRRMLTVCTNACAFHSMLVKNLLQEVSQKTLLLSRKVQIMSQKTTKEKLMAYLLDQAKQKNATEFTIPLDRQGLADFLGVERSAMSAEISKLRREGVLDSAGSRFVLHQIKTAADR